tara:strand:- start:130 stop:1686 length:1557 start_codon:yes stop_codon:yes gene_type:complete
MDAKIKLWHRVSKKTGKQNLYVDVVFGNTKTYQNRKQIQTPIKIDGKFWNKDNNELKRSHPNYEVLSHSIRELRNKIEIAVDRYSLGQINKDQLIANISGKTDYRSVDDYLDTELRTTRKGKTFQSYKDAFKTFKRYVGYENKKMKFSDINLNLMLKFKKSFFHSDIGKPKKSNNSFNTYVNTIKAIYNDAYDNGVVFKKFPVSKKLKMKKTRTQWTQATPEMFLKAIDNVDTLRQWESLAMWLLSFCCRGLYWGDFTTMEQANVKDNDLYNTWCSNDNIYILHNRHKTKDTDNDQMLIKINKYPTLQLFRYVKLSFAKRMFKTRPDIVSDVNDWVSIFKYDLNADTTTHRDVTNSYQKGLREVWNIPLDVARKTFNNVAGECQISSKLCDLLIGHRPDSVLNMMSYTNYQTSEYAKQIEDAHSLVLKTFKVDKLADKLIDKLEEISAVRSKKIPYWITRSTAKLDSAGNVFIYASRTSKGYDREKEIEDNGFSEYFKNENEHIDKLDTKKYNLSYNR